MSSHTQDTPVSLQPNTSSQVIFEGWSPYASSVKYSNSYWQDIKVKRNYRTILSPGSTAIQFGQSVFEGLKARRDQSGNIRIFRLKQNYERFVKSCERLCIPVLSWELFFQTVCSVITRNEQWHIPFSSDILYIRPIIFGTDSHVMPIFSKEYEFVVLTAPLRAYNNPQGLYLLAELKYSRTVKGGLGYAKTASNYAHQYYSNHLAKRDGYDAVLWLDAEQHNSIEECGTMNIFFQIKDKLITPNESDTILSGITRKSVIELSIALLKTPVEERTITIKEIAALAEEKQLESMFVTATAIGIQSIAAIKYGEQLIKSQGNNSIIEKLGTLIENIQSGTLYDTYNWNTQLKISN